MLVSFRPPRACGGSQDGTPRDSLDLQKPAKEALMLAEKYKDIFPEYMKAQKSKRDECSYKLNKKSTHRINNNFHNNRPVEAIMAKNQIIYRTLLNLYYILTHCQTSYCQILPVSSTIYYLIELYYEL